MALMSLLIVAASVIGYYMQQRPPDVAPNTYLVLDVGGELPEQNAPDISGQLLGGGGPATFIPLLRNIEKAGTDSRVTGVLLKPQGIRAGWAKLEELRSALEKFRQQNKKVIAVLGQGGAREYYLATVADEVILSPTGFLDLKGMRAEVSFFKDMLGKVGIQADLEHIGRYKNFSDQFTESQMSDAFREATTSMLDAVYDNLVETVAAARERTAEEIRDRFEQEGPFEADRALEIGLVDELAYEDEVWKRIEEENPEQKPKRMEMRAYSRVPRSDVGLNGGERIALVYAVGSITNGKDSFDPVFSGKTMGSDSLTEVLKTVSEDESTKGVLVRIDSPGGDAFASDEIWRAMMLLREKKPLVISMSDLAASGGYYMAATGDPIVAQPGTLTGSIGIIYGKLNLKGLYDKIGVQKEIIRRGPYSAMDSDYGPYTPAERERVRALMDDFYQDFVAKVAEARMMTVEEVDQIAQGRVWTGEQAKDNGLVDELGGLDTALGILKKNAGISPDAQIELVEFPRRKSLIEMVVERLEEENVRAALEAWTGLTMPWKQIEQVFPSPVWARMPYAVEFD
jgi:protease-4